MIDNFFKKLPYLLRIRLEDAWFNEHRLKFILIKKNFVNGREMGFADGLLVNGELVDRYLLQSIPVSQHFTLNHVSGSEGYKRYV